MMLTCSLLIYRLTACSGEHMEAKVRYLKEKKKGMMWLKGDTQYTVAKLRHPTWNYYVVLSILKWLNRDIKSKVEMSNTV